MKTKYIAIIAVTIYLIGFLAGRATASEVRYDLNSTMRGNQQVAIESVNLDSMNWSDDIPAKPAESIDMYLKRMSLRRDDVQYQACLERMKYKAVEADKSNSVSACVPPDYSIPEMQKYSEWNGTVMGGLA